MSPRQHKYPHTIDAGKRGAKKYKKMKPGKRINPHGTHKPRRGSVTAAPRTPTARPVCGKWGHDWVQSSGGPLDITPVGERRLVMLSCSRCPAVKWRERVKR